MTPPPQTMTPPPQTMTPTGRRKNTAEEATLAALAFAIPENLNYMTPSDSDESLPSAGPLAPPISSAYDFYWGNEQEELYNDANENSGSRWIRSLTETTDTTWHEAVSVLQEHKEAHGVAIPLGLQEFFGVDFLPFEYSALENGTPEPPAVLSRTNNNALSELSLEENNNDLAPTFTEVPIFVEDEPKRQRTRRGSKTLRKIQKTVGRVRRRGRKNTAQQQEEIKEEQEPACKTMSLQELHGEIDFQLAQLQSSQLTLEQHKEKLISVETETEQVSKMASDIMSRVRQSQQEIAVLESALATAVRTCDGYRVAMVEQQEKLERLDRLRADAEISRNDCEESIKQQLSYVETLRRVLAQEFDGDSSSRESAPSTSTSTHKLSNVVTPPKVDSAPRLKECEEITPKKGNVVVSGRAVPSVFIRVNDLFPSPLSQPLLSSHDDEVVESHNEHDMMISLDENVQMILNQINKIGLQIVTDEGDRWQPTRDTEKILAKRELGHQLPGDEQTCPNLPWVYASGKDILVWTGQVDHAGFGSDLPVVKARGVVNTSPRELLGLLMDSSRVKEYNKMSLGRKDEFIIQQGVDTKHRDSEWGFHGEAKIMKSSNKPPLMRKTIDVKVLLHARPLNPDHGEGEGYLVVSRSVWENSDATYDASDSTLRSEMLLGVNYLRPVYGTDDDNGSRSYCELTTITHVYSPGVPQVLGRKMAPTVAGNFIRDMQSLWK